MSRARLHGTFNETKLSVQRDERSWPKNPDAGAAYREIVVKMGVGEAGRTAKKVEAAAKRPDRDHRPAYGDHKAKRHRGRSSCDEGWPIGRSGCKVTCAGAQDGVSR